ncbi:MAG: methyltransferase domain-containing protein [Ignavibacteriales bacterium]|nr:methyltransferase domain-containing protein [Ignavibacteriales bacterium]
MKQETQNIFLPGGFKQFRILKTKYVLNDKNILVIGSGSEKIAEKMIESGARAVTMIVNDYDSLINARLNLITDSKVVVKMMDFDNTDFNIVEFDLVYAQASISLLHRNKIVKEIKRILKPDGTLCVAEITVLTNDYPPFVRNIFDTSEMLPLLNDGCGAYYTERNFSVSYEEDLSSSLQSFYEHTAQELDDTIYKLNEKEKSYYKKLLKKISHESNAYLKLGADRYIGFKMLILKKTI